MRMQDRIAAFQNLLRLPDQTKRIQGIAEFLAKKKPPEFWRQFIKGLGEDDKNILKSISKAAMKNLEEYGELEGLEELKKNAWDILQDKVSTSAEADKEITEMFRDTISFFREQQFQGPPLQRNLLHLPSIQRCKD